MENPFIQPELISWFLIYVFNHTFLTSNVSLSRFGILSVWSDLSSSGSSHHINNTIISSPVQNLSICE